MQTRPAAVAALALVLVLSASAQTYTVKPFAGGAVPESGAAASASLGTIAGIAVDAKGNVFLSLGDYDIVVRMDATTGALTRIAGTGIAGYSGDGGPANRAQLSGPAGLALDAAGNLYVADSNNSRIRRVSNGTITTVVGTGIEGYSGDGAAATQAELDGPVDVAFDANGDLYIADFFNQVVRKVSGGMITTVAGDGTYGSGGDGGPARSAQLSGPAGITLDAAGALYIAEVYGNRVRKVAGGIITAFAGNGNAGFTGDKGAATSATLRQPVALACDANGRIYIADYGNNRIRSVLSGTINTAAGNGTTVTSGDQGAATSAGLAGPWRLATDPSGSLYIADANRLRKVYSNGITTVAGGGLPAGEGGPAESAQIASPQGVAVDASGAVYVTDSGTGRVLKVSGGTLTRVAGTASQGNSGDNGPATSAQLASPAGVAVDRGGNVYVSDTVSARIRRIANGTITTFAGGGSAFGDNGPATSAQLKNPQGLALDAAGNLFVADLNRVRMITSSSGIITTVAGNGSAGFTGDGGPATAAWFSSPQGVAVDAASNLYIADTGNNRIRLVANAIASTAAGNGNYGFTTTTTAPTAAAIGTPAGVATDASGALYITDAYRVLKMAGGKLSTLAAFSRPQGIAVDDNGNLYVADPPAHRVWMLSPAGTTCAATATAAITQIAASGGRISIAIQTGASCTWAVENLPVWMEASSTSGVGPATVFLDAVANSGAPRSVPVTVGGQSIIISQAGIISIAGQVTFAGVPLAGATVALGGGVTATTSTDSGGNFSFANLTSAATYIVSASMPGYNLLPASLTYANPTSNPAPAFVAWAVPQISSMAPAFAGWLQPTPATFASGEIISVYGAGLCADAAQATPTLPDRLAACIAQVDGANVRLYYAAPGQINLVLPQSLNPGPHSLVIQRYTDTAYKTLAAQSTAYAFRTESISMALVERSDNGTRLLLMQFSDGSYAGSSRSLRPGDNVILYLTGLGKKVQSFAEGAAPGKAAASVESIQVTVEGVKAAVAYSGVQPQFPGLDQINLQLPQYVRAPTKSTATIQITAVSTGRTLSYEVPSN